MRVIVLAGGKGDRLSPYTKVLPKPLMPLDGIPILEILLVQLRGAGFHRVTVAVWYKETFIERYIGDGERLGMQLEYSRTDRPLGTAGPLAFVEPLDEACLVINGDLLTTVDYSAVIAAHQSSGATATMVVCPYFIEVGFGVVELAAPDRVLRYAEKPSHNVLISGGIFVLEPAALHYIAKGHYLDMPELIGMLLRDGHHVNPFRFDGDWHDIGTPEQYAHAEEAFQLHRSRFLACSLGTEKISGGHQMDLAPIARTREESPSESQKEN